MKKITFHAELISTIHSNEDFSGYHRNDTPEKLDEYLKEWAAKEANRLSENGSMRGGYRVSSCWVTIGPGESE